MKYLQHLDTKTWAKLGVSAVLVVLAIILGCGIGRGGRVDYQIPGPYTAERANDFSTVRVAMTVDGDRITDCEIATEGASDLMTDELRQAWAQSIVDNQSADNDVISGATLTYSAASVREAVDDIMVQAGLKEAAEPTAAPEPTESPEPAEAEAPAGDLIDGTYSVQKTTDFSEIDVSLTVAGGAVTDASVVSSGANDLLTDDTRNAWASQIVERQAVDAVSGVTVSTDAVQEAVDELMAQARGEVAVDGAADARLAELEAALAESEARREEAEAKAAEAEAKVAELEAAAATAATATAEPAQTGDASRMMRPRPVIEAVETAEPAQTGDASRMMRPRPFIEAAETAEPAETGDASRMMRPRPFIEVAESAEPAQTGDASRMMRPRPGV